MTWEFDNEMMSKCDVKYSQEAMSWDMLVYVAIIKAIKMMLTNNFNSKDIGVVDVIQEMKISSTSNGLVSITWEMWWQSSENTLYEEHMYFLGSLHKSKQTCIVGYLCLLFVYIGRAQSYGRSLHIFWKQYHKTVALKWKYFQIIKWI